MHIWIENYSVNASPVACCMTLCSSQENLCMSQGQNLVRYKSWGSRLCSLYTPVYIQVTADLWSQQHNVACLPVFFFTVWTIKNSGRALVEAVDILSSLKRQEGVWAELLVSWKMLSLTVPLCSTPLFAILLNIWQHFQHTCCRLPLPLA